MTLDKKPDIIRRMFDRISAKYDCMNTIISFGMHKSVKRDCIKAVDIKSGYKVLDLCCGTGDLPRIIKEIQPQANVTGVDFSQNMLDIAEKKSRDIKFIKSDVSDLPFNDNDFDIVTVGFGLRNILYLDKTIEEICRVLKNGGYFMNIDFYAKGFWGFLYKSTVKIINRFFCGNDKAYEYLLKSIDEFASPEDLIKHFEKKNFKLRARKDYFFGVISCQILQKSV